MRLYRRHALPIPEVASSIPKVRVSDHPPGAGKALRQIARSTAASVQAIIAHLES
jgi:hypothetical protein